MNNYKSIITLALFLSAPLALQAMETISKRAHTLSLREANGEELVKQAKAYLFGRGVERDYVRGRELLEQAAIQTDNLSAKAGAQAALAEIFYIGRGVPKDSERAYRLYEIVALQTHNLKAAATAHLRLGQRYLIGQDVVRDDAQGLHFLELAANQTHHPQVQDLAKKLLLDEANNLEEGVESTVIATLSALSPKKSLEK